VAHLPGPVEKPLVVIARSDAAISLEMDCFTEFILSEYEGFAMTLIRLYQQVLRVGFSSLMMEPALRKRHQ